MANDILLIAPRFYSYVSEIENGLIKKGYSVTVVFEEPKIMTRVFVNKLKSGSIKAFVVKKWNKALFRQIKRKKKKYSFLFVIRGNLLENSLIQKIKKNFMDPNARSVYYTWDSLLYLYHRGSLGQSFDKCFTFDKVDAKTIGWECLPLFYIDNQIETINNAINQAAQQICCISSFNSYRYQALLNIIGQNQSKHFLIRLFIDKKLLFFKRLFDKGFRTVDMSLLMTKKMSLGEVFSIYQNSIAILDITDPKQNGLSMRTIESIGFQRKLITNNKNVADYNFFNENNVLLLDEKGDCNIDDDWLKAGYICDESIRKEYSLESWIDTILRHRV